MIEVIVIITSIIEIIIKGINRDNLRNNNIEEYVTNRILDMINKKELDFSHIINKTSKVINHINNNHNDITNNNNIYNNNNNNENNNNLNSNDSNQEEELSISSLNSYQDEESLNSIGIDEEMMNRFPRNIIDDLINYRIKIVLLIF